jgi:hypothetical protein
MVVEMNKQDPSMERISQIQDSVHVHLSKIPSPAKWDSFWKYYHRGIKNLYEKELIDDFYKEFTLKDYRYKNKSITIPMSLGFAQYKYLTGQIDESKQIFETLGVPPEDSWWISEPFNVSQGFNQTFWPEEKDMSQIMAQKDLDEFWIRKFDGINDGFIKVDRIREMDINQAVYAVLPLYSSRPLNIKIQLSASQPFMLWVNNHLLVTKNKKESPLIDKYSVMTNMRSGTNWLVVKLIGRVGPFGFYLRTTDENGNHVPQLTHYLDSQPALSLALNGENE